ncbi:MAG: cobalt ECF transporter T component CbiQ [Desulfobacterales bacterium]
MKPEAMIDEPFIETDARIHYLDPRLRIIAATAYAFSVALLQRFEPLTVAVVLSLLMIIAAGVDMRAVCKRLLVFNGLILLFWLVLPLTFTGEALYRIGPLTVTRPGVIMAARITLKANAIMPAFIVLVSTLPVAEIGHALEKLKVPKKIVHILLLTYRYIFVIEQEYQRLRRAMRARGFIPKTNLHTYKTYAYLIGMIFVRSLDRAHRVHQAMICRGFNGTFHSLRRFSLKTSDFVFSAVMAAAVIGLEVMEWLPIR